MSKMNFRIIPEFFNVASKIVDFVAMLVFFKEEDSYCACMFDKLSGFFLIERIQSKSICTSYAGYNLIASFYSGNFLQLIACAKVQIVAIEPFVNSG